MSLAFTSQPEGRAPVSTEQSLKGLPLVRDMKPDGDQPGNIAALPHARWQPAVEGPPELTLAQALHRTAKA